VYGQPFQGFPRRAPFLMETDFRDKARQFLWFAPEGCGQAVTECRPSRACDTFALRAESVATISASFATPAGGQQWLIRSKPPIAGREPGWLAPDAVL